MELVAFCDKDPEMLTEAVCEARDVLGFATNGYTDYEEMLEKEKPDLVHIVTSPAVPRHTWLEPARDAGVKALVLEKPYALTPNEHFAVSQAVSQVHDSMLVMVNHQRRYMDFAYALREILQHGYLGDITHIYAQAQGEIMEMATHLIDLVLLATGDQEPLLTWATINGGNHYDVPYLNCPDNLLAMMVFPERVRVTFEVTVDAMSKPDWRNVNRERDTEHYPNRCNLYVYGTNGRFWWREYGDWGYRFEKGPIEGEGIIEQEAKLTDYFADDPPAQKRFNQHIRDIIQPKRRGQTPEAHHSRFELAYLGMKCLLTMYKSALQNKALNDLQPIGQHGWDLLKAQVNNWGIEP
jgi:predicted dehydrogenase